MSVCFSSRRLRRHRRALRQRRPIDGGLRLRHPLFVFGVRRGTDLRIQQLAQVPFDLLQLFLRAALRQVALQVEHHRARRNLPSYCFGRYSI